MYELSAVQPTCTPDPPSAAVTLLIEPLAPGLMVSAVVVAVLTVKVPVTSPKTVESPGRFQLIVYEWAPFMPFTLKPAVYPYSVPEPVTWAMFVV